MALGQANAPTIGSTGAVETLAQDATNPLFFVKSSFVTNETALAAPAVINSYNITVVSDAGVLVGDYLGVFSLTTQRFYAGYVVAKPGANVLTLDTPLDSAFPIGAIIGTGSTNMNVDGSVAPVEFDIRGADPGLDAVLDVTRALITCVTTNAINLTDFGDIAGGLERGLLIRRDDGVTQNIVNFKDNIGMKGKMFDWDSLDDSNPGQGLHGFVGRLTFSKLGAVVRIGPGERLVYRIQDDLRTLLRLEVENEGHLVQP